MRNPVLIRVQLKCSVTRVQLSLRRSELVRVHVSHPHPACVTAVGLVLRWRLGSDTREESLCSVNSKV